MKFSEALLIIKEFFLEVLGFLIPGLIALIIPMPYLSQGVQSTIFSIIEKEYHIYLVIIFAYVIGYAIFGACELFGGYFCTFKRIDKKKVSDSSDKSRIKSNTKIIFLSFKKFQAKLEKDISESQAYKASEKKMIEENVIKEGSISRVRDLRNLALSYMSKSEKASIYTWVFRSDLCRHISTVLWAYTFLGLVGLLLSLIPFCRNQITEIFIFQNAAEVIILLSFFFILSVLLEKTRRRFHSIAHRVPYSIFIANAKERINEE